MSTKFLNLDEVAGEDRVLKLDGKEHKMADISVDSFVQSLRDAKKVDKDAPIEDQMDEMVKIISRSFPSVGEERLRKLSLIQLDRLMTFVTKPPESVTEEPKKGNE